MTDLLLSAHAAATCAMAGVIWIVQVVAYPLFARVPPEGWSAFHGAWMARITLVVGPLMLGEAAAATGLLLRPPPGAEGLARLGMGLLLGVWIATAAFSVPCHRRLERGHDERAIRRLVATNWIRTVLWTGRAALALAMMR